MRCAAENVERFSLRTGRLFLKAFIVLPLACVASLAPVVCWAQAEELARFVAIPAVAGYEQALAKELREELKELSPKSDNLGNVFVTLGTGAPHRLIVTPMDEPGYVVSGITADGFLRVQRLPQGAPHPSFDLLHFAEPVWVMTRNGKKVAGVFAGLSVHLQSGRQNGPKMNHPDEMYVDIGAASAEDVRAIGVDLLDQVALNRTLRGVGPSGLSAPAIGDRFGCAALVNLALAMKGNSEKLSGALTIAFAAQQWTGGRGLDRLLTELHPDEMVYVGRLAAPRGGANAGQGGTPKRAPPGSGALLGVSDAQAPLRGLAADLKKIAEDAHLTLLSEVSASPRIAGGGGAAFPPRFAQLGVPVLYPVTPGETLDAKDERALADLLYRYAAGEAPAARKTKSVPGATESRSKTTIGALVEVYGASGHEEAVRNLIQTMLPKWAKTETDSAGNLVLRMGDAKEETKAPRIAFVAHMDEIGYQVRSIESDGRLVVDVLGGGYTEYFLGHPVLVHTEGKPIGGVLEPPTGWDQAGFEWPRNARSMDEAVHVYVGTKSAEETLRLGIKSGDWVTIPKEFRPLLGTRANGRSFDDRVGCAALVEAVRAIGPNLPGRDVTFIWSTEEEVGLKGAAAAAERMAKEGRAPDFVFAIDTFVSADSPLEVKRFANAEIGKGFVVRAVDNSNITPREFVDRVVKLARENKIAAQYGVTGGGDDGSAFLRYGSVDIALGWPLRYSHSPGEVIDTRDLDALAKIIAALAKSW